MSPEKKLLLPEAVHESKKSMIQNKPHMQANNGYRTTRRYGNSVELTDCQLLD